MRPTKSRVILIFILLAAGATNSFAQEKPIEIKAYTEYDYNFSSGHYGSLSAIGTFPITEYFDLRAGINAATENSYTFDGRATVGFPLKTGRLLLENRISYQAVVRNSTHDLCAALSLGYHMDHFSVSFGGYSRLYCPMGDTGHNGNIDYIIEPFNIYWSIEGRLRKDSDIWNLGLRVSTFDDFHIERGNQPTATLLGNYKPAEKIRIFGEIFCEPSGVFHMSADFYRAGIRLGINYLIAR